MELRAQEGTKVSNNLSSPCQKKKKEKKEKEKKENPVSVVRSGPTHDCGHRVFLKSAPQEVLLPG